MYPDSLKRLIESFKYIPGVGEKTAERYAFSLMDMPEERVEFFLESIQDVKEKVKQCKICNYLTEEDTCYICSDKLRDDEILCVIEDVKSLAIFEKLGLFHGRYHVLNGLISPLDGVNPEDIGLDVLLERIRNGKYREIILAFKPSVEGETTALYIKKILDDMNIIISRIASGIPIGADMEYMDAMTLERALLDRKNLE